MKEELRKRRIRLKNCKDSNNEKLQNTTVMSHNTLVEAVKEVQIAPSFGGKSPNKLKTKKKRRYAKTPSLPEVEQFVLKSVIGQNEAVRKVVTGVYRAREFKSIKTNMLIIGQSGTGKTEIIRQISEKLNIPYTIEDATKYTQEGYYGADVTDMLSHLLENANGDLARAQKGILIIDEIDKKAGNEGIVNDVSGVKVLNSLLKMIEGTKVEVSNPLFDYSDMTNEEPPMLEFDTSDLIVIFMGAFSGLKKIRDKRLKADSMIGFSASFQKQPTEENQKYTKEDLIEYGLPEEFVGRIDTLIEMNVLTKNDLIQILGKANGSIFKKYTNELKRKGVMLQYDSNLFATIAKKSYNVKTGARELFNTVNYIFENITYDVLSAPAEYRNRTCVLSTDIVYDNRKYTWK